MLFGAALLHAGGVLPLRWVTLLDLSIDDARLRATLPGSRDARIAIVDIDERSLAELGRWPWGRDRIAQLADELFERQKAAVVGFDMVFAEPEPNDERLARALAGRPVVLGLYLTRGPNALRAAALPAPVQPAPPAGPVVFSHWDGHAGNLPLLAHAAPAAGFFNALPDDDGSIRSLPLLAELDGQLYPGLALEMLRRYTGAQIRADTQPGVWLTQGTSRLWIGVDERGAVRVPFRGAGGARGGSFDYVSATDLLNGRTAPAALAGRLVLIGSSAPGVFDLRSTPVAAVYPGVEVHASLLSALLDGRTLVRPDWARGYELLQLVAVLAVLALALPRLGAFAGVSVGIALASVLAAIDLWLYRRHGLVLPLANALLLTAGLYVASTAWSYATEGRRRRALARLFGNYVPPELVAEMAQDPQRYTMRAENRELTLMFCDMRNFSRISESLAPEQLRGLVNRFFSTMTGAIRARRGTLDKYIGDAIMAFWGAPLDDPAHARHAVQAALEMIERMHGLNRELQQRGLPAIGLGIGLNSGLVCVGDMGSEVRRSYTAMGDAVNLASRIEGLTRFYSVDLLVGEATREAAGDAWRWVEVDRVRVKGRQQPVTLFTPAPDGMAGSARFEDEMRLWQLALAGYRSQDRHGAQGALDELAARFADSPRRGLHEQLRRRLEQQLQRPAAPDWDGTNDFDSK